MNNHKTGAGAIFRALLSDINEGVLKPGDSLASEQALMERFGVSRTMIRDAVAMLAGIGAVERAQGRTGVIQQVDAGTISHFFPLILRLSGLESIREVYELRILIESEAAAKACLRASDEQLQEIVTSAEMYDRAQRSRSRDGTDGGSDEMRSDAESKTAAAAAEQPRESTEYIATDVGLHMAIARASGNAMFVSLLEILTGFLEYVQFETCRGNLQRSREAGEEHKRIARAIASRDPDAARIEMSYHLRISRDALERIVDEQNGH
ncbi:MAG: FCD domain-containing protein [Chitinivibrionales bacterium]|nr:FCD domain-containing protein [Chitinivibrionales bacterium]